MDKWILFVWQERLPTNEDGVCRITGPILDMAIKESSGRRFQEKWPW